MPVNLAIPSLVMLAFAMMATIRHHANQPTPQKTIRRVATRLTQRRIQPAHVIACSAWRRAHQATAQHSYLKQKLQL